MEMTEKKNLWAIPTLSASMALSYLHNSTVFLDLQNAIINTKLDTINAALYAKEQLHLTYGDTWTQLLKTFFS